MSELATRLNVGEPGLLPGYRLVHASCEAKADAEQAFEARHMATAARASIDLPESAAQALLARATEDIALGYFSCGGSGFLFRCKSDANFPMLLALVAEPEEPSRPRPSPRQAEKLMPADKAERGRLWRKVMECFDYVLEAPKAGAIEAPKNESSAGGTGAESSTPSAPADSATAKSAS